MILNGMTLPEIRPMRPADVDEATDMVLSHGWGVRRDWLSFAATQPACTPLVAEAGGGIVATAVGTANGSVGWLGSIFIDPMFRGHGLGRAITEATIDRLTDAGVATLVLVATTEGRRLYARMGFEVQAEYRILEAPGIDGGAEPAAGGVRPFEPADLPAMVALDRAATGEDRSHALERLGGSETARVAADADGSLAGFVVRPPWGGGATVARSIGDALRLVEARRRTSGAGGRVRVGVLDSNREGLERLAAAGFVQAWSAPRLIRGEMPPWRPELIWGQFNHAIG